MWWISWSRGPQKVAKGNGYFNCPQCGRRQVCALSQVESRTHLYGIIPVSAGQPVGPEYYKCLACRGTFVNDGSYGYDFGPHAETATWRCFKCNKEVPYQDFECPHCGYRLEVGGR
jgi:DNA-directed RNA polymerase subunit RPC12/RpoP